MHVIVGLWRVMDFSAIAWGASMEFVHASFGFLFPFGHRLAVCMSVHVKLSYMFVFTSL